MAERKGNKNEFIILTFDRWVEVLQAGGRMDAFLQARGIVSVAVYGYGHMGKLLAAELHRSKLVHLAYVTDQSKKVLDIDVPFHLASEMLPPVDMIIVTAVYYFDDVRSALQSAGVQARIVSLYDLLNLMKGAGE